MQKPSFFSGRTLSDALIFVLGISSAGLLWRAPLILTLVYAALGFYLLKTRWSPATISYYLVGFFLGPIGEFYAVKNGAWEYQEGTTILPIWLPFGWGFSGVLLKSVGDTLSEMIAFFMAKKSNTPELPDRQVPSLTE